MKGWYCLVTNIQVPLERERLDFNFDGVNVSEIKYVELITKEGDRGFTDIPEEIFEIFPNMHTVDIQSNLKLISQPRWQKATNLKVVKLQYSQITIIRRGLFVGLDELSQLILKFNQIHSIEDGAFDFPHLWVLDLSNNKLTTLSDTLFSKIATVQILDISDNELTHIGNSMRPLQNAVWIDLHRNHIEDIDLLEFSRLPRLGTLVLYSSGFSFNLSEKVRNEELEHAGLENTVLEVLDISNNSLANLYNLNQLSIFKGLKRLALAANQFTNYKAFSAEYIKQILPNLQSLGWDGRGLDCENFEIFINQFQRLNMSIVNLVCYLPPCLSCRFNTF